MELRTEYEGHTINTQYGLYASDEVYYKGPILGSTGRRGRTDAVAPHEVARARDGGQARSLPASAVAVLTLAVIAEIAFVAFGGKP